MYSFHFSVPFVLYPFPCINFSAASLRSFGTTDSSSSTCSAAWRALFESQSISPYEWSFLFERYSIEGAGNVRYARRIAIILSLVTIPSYPGVDEHLPLSHWLDPGRSDAGIIFLGYRLARFDFDLSTEQSSSLTEADCCDGGASHWGRPREGGSFLAGDKYDAPPLLYSATLIPEDVQSKALQSKSLQGRKGEK